MFALIFDALGLVQDDKKVVPSESSTPMDANDIRDGKKQKYRLQVLSQDHMSISIENQHTNAQRNEPNLEIVIRAAPSPSTDSSIEHTKEACDHWFTDRDDTQYSSQHCVQTYTEYELAQRK
eukprot:237973_1